jgi:hypothetical protein
MKLPLNTEATEKDSSQVNSLRASWFNEKDKSLLASKRVQVPSIQRS